MKNQHITHKDVELGQMVFGNPVGEYECTDFIEALCESLFDEIDRIYWNKNQDTWDRYKDPEFPGIEFRPYYWGEEEEEAAKPNFKYKEVEVRWYKYPFRSATVNVSMTEKQWKQWFDSCMKAIRKNEPKLW